MTTAEFTRVRDVPGNCCCDWQYRTNPARWVRVAWHRGCPWHTVRVAS